MERLAHVLEQIARGQAARRSSNEERSQMFSRKKESKMAIFKDSNDDAVEEVSTTFLF